MRIRGKGGLDAPSISQGLREWQGGDLLPEREAVLAQPLQERYTLGLVLCIVLAY